MRFRYEGPPVQVVWRPHGCVGCSPIVAGGLMIGVGFIFQTGWAADVASLLLKVIGYLLVGFGAFAIIVSLVAWVTGRRGGQM